MAYTLRWLYRRPLIGYIVQAEIATAGTADSLLKATHIMRTKRAHQITADALHILQHRAFDHYSLSYNQIKFEAWHDERILDCP